MSINLDLANIVVPATSPAALADLAGARLDVPWDVLELRLDQLGGCEPKAPSGIPLLLTPRHPDEGGAEDCRSADQRAALVEPWLGAAAAIDVEIAQARAMASSLERARAAGLAVVLSFHDFAGTPTGGELADKVRLAADEGADVVKIATRTDAPGDVARLFGVFEEFPDTKLAVMGMGSLGKASRLLAAGCGSVLNYACQGEATVEGQWSAAEFLRLLEETGVR